MEKTIAVKIVPNKIPLPTDFVFSSLLDNIIIESNKEMTATNFNLKSIEFEASRNKK